jgi:hypothetical protein
MRDIQFLHDPRCDYAFRDPTTAKMAEIARRYRLTMMAGGFVQYSEQAILNGIWGNCCGKVRTAIAAAATAQTAIATGSFASGGASGNMDQTPNTTATIWVGTPGTGSTINQYTAPHAFLLTGSSSTSLTIASQSIGLAISVGDCIFLQGSSSAGGATTNAGPMWALNTLYIGLSTQSASGATQSNLLSGEPTSTGSYARIAINNTQANFPIASAATPSVLTAGGPFSFAASTAAWSTGATNLQTMFFADASTLAGGNVIAYGPLGTAQAVNASGITLSFASSAITITLT